jgi:hypothetical protein
VEAQLSTRIAALRRLLPILREQAVRRYKYRHSFQPTIAPGHSALGGEMIRNGAVAAETYVGHAVKIKNLDLQINDPADAHWRNHFADAGVPDPSTAYRHVDSVRRVKCMIISECQNAQQKRRVKTKRKPTRV